MKATTRKTSNSYRYDTSFDISIDKELANRLLSMAKKTNTSLIKLIEQFISDGIEEIHEELDIGYELMSSYYYTDD